MANVSAGTVSIPRPQLGATATGVLVENFHPTVGANSSSPSSQAINAILLGLRSGDVVTGIVLRNATAAAGTLPTTARFGIANATGKLLALSGNLNALANWALGPLLYPFTAPYTVIADGGYYACFVVNGTWGTTQPTLTLGVGGNSGGGAIGANAMPVGGQSAQTDLPAIGASVALNGTLGRGYYTAFY